MSEKVRVTKSFCFECAHMLPFHKGKCRNIHGHSYKLDVTVRGQLKSGSDDPEDGMVMDFSRLKEIVENGILRAYDHSLVLPRSAADTIRLDTKIIYTESSPTCEVLLLDMVGTVRSSLPGELELVAMRLSETDTSYSEWLLEDNL